MSFDAITSIASAEEEAKITVAKANEKARDMIAKAESEGKASVETAIASAEKKLQGLKADTEKKTDNDMKKFSQEIEDEKNQMRLSAESKLEKAATLVVERIVNG